MRRRDFLKALGIGVSAASVGGLLAACGGAASGSLSPASGAPANVSGAKPSAASSSGSPAASSAAAAKAGGVGGTIKLGILTDLTGPYAPLGKSLLNNIKLAGDEINAGSGPKVDFVVEDTATDPKTSVEKATKVTQSDKVAAVLGIISSAAREAVRPVIADRAKVPFIYTTPYEGGDCNRNLFVSNAVPSQEIDPYVPWMISNFGKKVYLFGADYVWPRTVFKVTNDVVKKNGGTVVGEEYVPLTATDFASLVPKVRAASPDIFVSAFPVPAWTNVVQLLSDAGLRKSMHIGTYFMDDPFAEGIPASLRDGISTVNDYWYDVPGDVNKQYLAAYHKKFGDKEPTTGLGLGAYQGLHLYISAVQAAGSTSTDAVRPALEKAKFQNSPGGPVAFNANHHMTTNIYIAVTKGGAFKIEKTLDQLVPAEACKF